MEYAQIADGRWLLVYVNVEALHVVQERNALLLDNMPRLVSILDRCDIFPPRYYALHLDSLTIDRSLDGGLTIRRSQPVAVLAETGTLANERVFLDDIRSRCLRRFIIEIDFLHNEHIVLYFWREIFSEVWPALE